jgi:hypothetical protein
MKKILILIITLALFNIGCASQKAWIYRTNNYSYSATQINKQIVVLPFKDLRENINSNKVVLSVIPLFPFGWLNFSAPEGSQVHMFTRAWTNYNPKEDFSKALAEELRATNIFKEAYFDFKKGESDFIIKGEILLTKYTCTLISYGLSVFGPNLWIIGFPSGTISNEIVIKLSCVDNNSSKVFFSKTYAAPRYKKWAWIYAPPIQFNYSSMLKDLYKDFTEDLKINLQKQARIKTRN